MLWPEGDTAQARHRLSNTLYVLRQALSEDPVVVAGEHLWLNRETIWADATAFEEALESGYREAALQLYGGPFLDGFHLGASQEFEDWLEAERTRLAELRARALESLARQAEQAGDPARAADWWKQLLATDPYNSRITVNLMEALAAAGDPANAIQQAQAHDRLLRDDLEIEPATEVRALVERLRAESAPGEGSERVRASANKLGPATFKSHVNRVVSGFPQPHQRWKWPVVGLVALAAVVTVAAVWGWLRTVSTEADLEVVEFYLDPPDPTMSFGAGLALSPDGSHLVAEVETDEGPVLYQRVLESRDWQIIPGTEGGYAPFFSPDGQWLGFLSQRERAIMRVPLEGGSAQTITRVSEFHLGAGASWGPDNMVVLSTADNVGLSRVPADGGEWWERLTFPDTEFGIHIQPHHLQSGEVTLFTAFSADLGPFVAALSLESGKVERLTPGMSPLSDGVGRVVYVYTDGTALVQRFNPRTLALEGPPMPIAEGIKISAAFFASYTVSSSGSLAYLTGPAQGDQLLLVDREGGMRPLFSSGPGLRLAGPRFSPSGDRIAFGLIEAGEVNGDIWVYSLAEGTAQRLSFEGPSADPAWASDGRSIGYSALGEGGGSYGLYVRAADGSGPAVQLLVGDDSFWQLDFAPGDSEIVFHRPNTVSRAALGSDSGPVRLIEPVGYVTDPILSPDGRWLAYTSFETGIFEVYVRSYPDMGPPTVVSIGGGHFPAWSGDGSEIFYWGSGRMMAASVRYVGSRIRVDRRAELFRTAPFRESQARMFAVHPSGQEFVLVGEPKTRVVWRTNALAGEQRSSN